MATAQLTIEYVLANTRPVGYVSRNATYRTIFVRLLGKPRSRQRLLTVGLCSRNDIWIYRPDGLRVEARINLTSTTAGAQLARYQPA